LVFQNVIDLGVREVYILAVDGIGNEQVVLWVVHVQPLAVAAQHDLALLVDKDFGEWQVAHGFNLHKLACGLLPSPQSLPERGHP
jgi:hypothetical protein